MDPKMRDDILEKTTNDLLSVPPLIFRGIRRKLLKVTLSDVNEDISPLHYEIIMLLHKVGTLHIAEIGERLLVARAQMTHLIDKLVALGMVERQVDNNDRRMIKIVLTAKSRAIVEEHDRNLRRAVRETLSCLADEEFEDLSNSLERLRKILSRLQ